MFIKRLRNSIKRLILNLKWFNYLPIYVYIRIWLFFNKIFLWLFLGSNMYYVKRLNTLPKWLRLNNLHTTKPKHFRNVYCSLSFPRFFINQVQRQGSVWLKYVYLWVFITILFIFKVFINIHKYANWTIYISDHRKKDMCLIFNLTPILVL